MEEAPPGAYTGGGPAGGGWYAMLVGGGATLVTSFVWPYFACNSGSDAEE